MMKMQLPGFELDQFDLEFDLEYPPFGTLRLESGLVYTLLSQTLRLPEVVLDEIDYIGMTMPPL